MFYLINTFSKVAGYKINLEKSVGFLDINNELARKKTNQTKTITVASKNFFGNQNNVHINLTKDVKDYCSGYYIPSNKLENTRGWKDSIFMIWQH